MECAGLITPSDFVRLTSTAAAHAFNIFPRKGVLAPRSDADIIIFDPAAEHVISAASHHSRMDTNIYEGRAVTGKARCPRAAMKQGLWFVSAVNCAYILTSLECRTITGEACCSLRLQSRSRASCQNTAVTCTCIPMY